MHEGYTAPACYQTITLKLPLPPWIFLKIPAPPATVQRGGFCVIPATPILRYFETKLLVLNQNHHVSNPESGTLTPNLWSIQYTYKVIQLSYEYDNSGR